MAATVPRHSRAAFKAALEAALTVEYHPTVTTVSGLVTDQAGSTYLHTERFVGFYCDEEECPEDTAEECALHPGEYWADTMRARYYYYTRDAGLTIDVDGGVR